MELSKLYKQRFCSVELKQKEKLWQILCKHTFQHYIQLTDTVLDLAAGSCNFINNIKCKRKIAVDLNEDTSTFATSDVQVFCSSCQNMKDIYDNSVDVVFTSNFFEHLPNNKVFLQVLQEIYRVLRPGGQLLILQPNIRFVGFAYYDFLDHTLPLTDSSVIEALRLVQFEPIEVRPRFLPYTTKSRLPQNPFLFRVYLAFPILHKIFGKQMFIVARKV
jgi:SAM-dependent methyltransferase